MSDLSMLINGLAATGTGTDSRTQRARKIRKGRKKDR